jgi:hypothetical protein
MNENLQKQLQTEENKINKSAELLDAYELAKQVADKKRLFGIKREELESFKQELNTKSASLDKDISTLQQESIKLQSNLQAKQELNKRLQVSVAKIHRDTANADNEFAEPLELREI